ncbi:MAG TPA: 4Fe-4S dicluster domain-containing protein, partial [Candidatus Limnocylindrales bacterium]|nr:4Fe-4S dicluster domain-containing protein [Candidatus Limnocylindrales bacterium]
MTERRPLALPGDDLQQCIHCGMCLEACPTYRITGLETESPRGRIHIMSGLASGAIATDDDAARLHLDRCLACRACEAVCPSGVPYGRLIELARGGLAAGDRAGGRSSRLERLLLRGLVSHPRRLALLASVLSLYERTGLRAL